jgi:colanic acid/amylovoran biosynthesis glycosyltransferase
LPHAQDLTATSRPFPRSRLGRAVAPSTRYRLTTRLRPNQYARTLTRFVLGEHQRSPIDVIHAHFGTAGAMLVDLRLTSGLPLVTTFYGVDASACLRNPRWNKPYARLFTAGDLFIVLSEQVCQRLIDAGAPGDRILVWNIGMDLAGFTALGRPQPTPEPSILCVARFVEKKGHPLLLDAFASLRAQRRAHLTLMGYGPLKRNIEQRVLELGLEHDVTIVDTTGRADFMTMFRAALSSHTVFALPSLTARDGDDEGGPALTAVYAQAAGMPVVVTAFPGAERSVVDRQTGMICDADAVSLRAALEEVIDDPQLAMRIGENASALVQREFDLDTQRGILHEIYARLISTSSANEEATQARPMAIPQ